MEIHEALTNYFEGKGISQVAIAQRLRVSRAYVNSLLSGRQRFGKKQAQIWNDIFGISKAWLLTGEGEMLNDGADPTPEIDDPMVEKDKDKERLIPFYDVETTGGYNGMVSASDEGDLVGYIQPGGWFDSRETAAIRHVGDSMAEYPSGCILAVRRVVDRHLLVPGRNYVIETTEYRITKRLQKINRAEQTLLLYSTNTDKYEDGSLIHAPFEVSLSDVINIYTVLGYIVNQSGEMRLIRSR